MSRTRTLFRREQHAWIAVAVYAVILYSTLTIAFDLYVSVFDRVGKATVSWWMNVSLGAAGLAVALLVIRLYRPRLSGYLILLASALTVAFSMNQLSVPAKRFHFFQYGPLTLLLFDALRFRLRGRDLYGWAFIGIALVGLGDELLQAALPDRHFGVVDLAVNATAGAIVLALIGLVAGDENYPWPTPPELPGASMFTRPGARLPDPPRQTPSPPVPGAPGCGPPTAGPGFGPGHVAPPDN